VSSAYTFTINPSSPETYYDISEREIDQYCQKAKNRSEAIRRAIGFYIKYRREPPQDMMDTHIKLDAILNQLEVLKSEDVLRTDSGDNIMTSQRQMMEEFE